MDTLTAMRYQTAISSVLAYNVFLIKEILVDNSDLIERPFTVTLDHELDGVIFYIDGLSNNQLISQALLDPLIHKSLEQELLGGSRQQSIGTIEKILVTNPEVKIVKTVGEAIDNLLTGESIVVVEGLSKAFTMGTKGWEARMPSEPATELVVRGPRDSFTENMRTNTSLLRRRIKDPMLRLKTQQIGTRTKTAVTIAYLEDVANQRIVMDVQERLQSIKIDAVLESGYLEEMITDARHSPFVTMKTTERPDAAAAAILEGRVVIISDNTPFSLIVPSYFWDGFMASDDYYASYFLGTFSRIIRLIALVISLTLPSLYVLLVSFHQEMIPTQLALSMAAGRESVPFPVLVEVLLMEIAFELMREAGLRMPRPVGQAVSIVGSLIIGQAAVQAGLVSPIMVIIIAVTGIASFAIPSYATSFTIRFLRFPLLLASGMLGLLGFTAVLYVLTVHALSLQSFGEPYVAPIIPFRPSEQKDSLLRVPWWKMNTRPTFAKEKTRQPDPLDEQRKGQKSG